MSTYLCGLDIGGTFTDCVIVDDRGRVTSAKAPSTPGDFAEGLMNALDAAARKCGQPVAELLAETALVSHGTTVGTNAIVAEAGRPSRARHHPRAQRRSFTSCGARAGSTAARCVRSCTSLKAGSPPPSFPSVSSGASPSAWTASETWSSP